MEKGKELLEVLRLFKQATTSPLSSFLLDTPKHKANSKSQTSEGDGGPDKQRKSPRLSGKGGTGKSVLRLAQDLVAKKCGIFHDEEALDEMTLQDYLNMYKEPLSNESMKAIVKLTEVAKEKKKSKTKVREKKDKTNKLKKVKESGKGKKKIKVMEGVVGVRAPVGA
jgi:hypothetical protein